MRQAIFRGFEDRIAEAELVDIDQPVRVLMPDGLDRERICNRSRDPQDAGLSGALLTGIVLRDVCPHVFDHSIQKRMLRLRNDVPLLEFAAIVELRPSTPPGIPAAPMG